MTLNFLEVCLSGDLGGLELCVVDYFEYFDSKANSKIVVAPDSKLDKRLRSENKFLLKRNKFFPIISAIKLAKYIDKNDIDIMHFHWTKDIATVVLAKLLSRKKPRLIQSRHMRMTRFKDDFYHKWLYKYIDMIHAVTNEVKEQLERFIPQDIRPKIEMIYLGVNEPVIDEKKLVKLKKDYGINDEFIVGIIGRIEEAKGQYLLIEALNLLKDLNIKILVVGNAMDESYLSTLKNRVETLGLKERVIFTGFTKDINEHIRVCDLTVLATKKETFGLVVIESMVNRVPVIATNSGGPLEIMQDSISGMFFDLSSIDLAEKIKYLYENREIKNEISKNAYERAKKLFNKEIQMSKVYEVFHAS